MPYDPRENVHEISEEILERAVRLAEPVHMAGFTAHVAVFADSYFSELYARYKSGKDRLDSVFAALLEEKIRQAAVTFDAIVPIPIHAREKRERTFDAVHELAARLSERTGVPVVEALRKTRLVPLQRGLSHAERKINLVGAFQKVTDVEGRVLLLDDYVTTGSTFLETGQFFKDPIYLALATTHHPQFP